MTSKVFWLQCVLLHQVKWIIFRFAKKYRVKGKETRKLMLQNESKTPLQNACLLSANNVANNLFNEKIYYSFFVPTRQRKSTLKGSLTLSSRPHVVRELDVVDKSVAIFFPISVPQGPGFDSHPFFMAQPKCNCFVRSTPKNC